MRKKNFILFIPVVFLFFLDPLYSQDKQIKLGFQLGPSFSNVSINNPYTGPGAGEYGGKTDLFGGILAEIKMGDMFYIQPEINFIQKGFSYDIHNWGTQELTSNYFEIAVNMMAKFIKGSFSPFIFAGPSFNFLSKATQDIVYSDTRLRFSSDATSLIKKTDIAVNFGGGAELSLSKNIDVFVMARYSLGLMDITVMDDPNTEEVYNRCISLAAGLKFTL